MSKVSLPRTNYELCKRKRDCAMSHPECSYALMALDVKFSTDTPTAAVDGDCIYINKQWMQTNCETVEHLYAVFVHEALHCMWAFFDRVDAKDFLTFNAAQDYLINKAIEMRRLPKINGCLIDNYFDPKSKTSEQVYDILIREQQRKEEGQQAGDNNGEENNNNGEEGETNNDASNNGESDETGDSKTTNDSGNEGETENSGNGNDNEQSNGETNSNGQETETNGEGTAKGNGNSQETGDNVNESTPGTDTTNVTNENDFMKSSDVIPPKNEQDKQRLINKWKNLNTKKIDEGSGNSMLQSAEGKQANKIPPLKRIDWKRELQRYMHQKLDDATSGTFRKSVWSAFDVYADKFETNKVRHICVGLDVSDSITNNMEYYEDLTNVVNIIMGLYPNIPFTIIQCDREIVCIDEKVKRRWKGKLIHGRGTVLTPMIQRMVKNIKADVNIILTDLQIHSFDLPLSLQAKIKNPVWLLYGPRICMTNYPNKGLRIHVNGTKILKG